MKKCILYVLFCLLPVVAMAHPGKTDRYGGHKCIKGCEEWKLYFNEYHLHDKDGKPIRVAQSRKKPKAKPVADLATIDTLTAQPISIPVRTEVITVTRTVTVREENLLVNPLFFFLLVLLILLLIVRMSRKRT